MAGPVISDFSRVAIEYVDDAGTHHHVRQRTQTQVKVGNALADNTAKTGRPPGWKLRHILGKYVDPSSHVVYHKRAVVASVTNGLWTGATATWNEDGVLWVVQGRIGERRTDK